MDVMGALISVDGLQVHHVPDHMVLISDPIPAQHVPAVSGNLQRLPTRVPLDQGNLVRAPLACILETSNLDAALEAERNLGGCVGHFALRQLVGSQGPAELAAGQKVLPGRVEAGLGSPEGSPRDPEPRIVQAAERALQQMMHARIQAAVPRVP